MAIKPQLRDLMLPIFALTTRGLEDVSLRELAALPGIITPEIQYRRVAAGYTGDPARLLTLRTVDDVFLSLALWENLTHTRQALTDLELWSKLLDVRPIIGSLQRIRSINPQPSYSVTANFVGKRNYTMPEIKAAVHEGIQASHPRWRYTDDDAYADINLRVFIDHETALVGVRLAEHPLYRRGYKQAHLPGSLKPSVAAAMLMLANAQPTHTLLDPFCGSGTLLIEAGLDGLTAIGGDVDRDALIAARANADDAAISVTLAGWDARHLPLKTASVDLVVSNLPWGRQIPVSSTIVDTMTALSALYQDAFAEMRRVVKPGGRIALLTSLTHLLEDLLEWETVALIERREISLFGQNPTIIVVSHG